MYEQTKTAPFMLGFVSHLGIYVGSRRKLNRVTSVGDLRFPADHSPGERWGGGRGSLERGRGRSSADESRANSRGSRESGGGSSSGGGGGVRGKLSASGGSSDGHRKVGIYTSP